MQSLPIPGRQHFPLFLFRCAVCQVIFYSNPILNSIRSSICIPGEQKSLRNDIRCVSHRNKGDPPPFSNAAIVPASFAVTQMHTAATHRHSGEHTVPLYIYSIGPSIKINWYLVCKWEHLHCLFIECQIQIGQRFYYLTQIFAYHYALPIGKRCTNILMYICA